MGNSVSKTKNLDLDSSGIHSWLTHYLVNELSMKPEEVDVEKRFDEFGIDSAKALKLVGDLEDYLGYRLPPSLPYQYPTIQTLSVYLAENTVSN